MTSSFFPTALLVFAPPHVLPWDVVIAYWPGMYKISSNESCQDLCDGIALHQRLFQLRSCHGQSSLPSSTNVYKAVRFAGNRPSQQARRWRYPSDTSPRQPGRRIYHRTRYRPLGIHSERCGIEPHKIRPRTMFSGPLPPAAVPPDGIGSLLKPGAN